MCEKNGYIIYTTLIREITMLVSSSSFIDTVIIVTN